MQLMAFGRFHHIFLFIRDGDQDLTEKHKTTQLTEFFSIKLLKFNKSQQSLNFISGEKLKQWAEKTGFNIETIKNQKHTSNVIFAIRKKMETITH